MSEQYPQYKDTKMLLKDPSIWSRGFFVKESLKWDEVEVLVRSIESFSRGPIPQLFNASWSPCSPFTDSDYRKVTHLL